VRRVEVKRSGRRGGASLCEQQGKTNELQNVQR
jgi:hypothetical protein